MACRVADFEALQCWKAKQAACLWSGAQANDEAVVKQASVLNTNSANLLWGQVLAVPHLFTLHASAVFSIRTLLQCSKLAMQKLTVRATLQTSRDHG